MGAKNRGCKELLSASHGTAEQKANLFATRRRPTVTTRHRPPHHQHPTSQAATTPARSAPKFITLPNRHPTFCSRRIVPDTPTPHARTRARHRLEAVLWPCTASNCACRLRTSSRQSTWHPSGIFSFLRTPPRRSSATRANASQPPRLPMHGTISHVQSLEVDRSPPPRATFAADASVV